MNQANIGELKNNLSRYLDLVRQGQTVRILDRNIPIAQLIPLHRAKGEDDATLEQLERSGVIRRGSGRVDPDLLAKDPPGKASGVLAALLEERNAR